MRKEKINFLCLRDRESTWKKEQREREQLLNSIKGLRGLGLGLEMDPCFSPVKFSHTRAGPGEMS